MKAAPEDMLNSKLVGKPSIGTMEFVREALSVRQSAIDVSYIISRESLFDISETFGSEWTNNGNIILSTDAGIRPNIVAHPGITMPNNSTIILGKNLILPSVVMVWGSGALIVIGDEVYLPGSGLYCGGGSAILLEGHISCAGEGQLNARNGGSIEVGRDGLWSNKVYMATDDMHAILDKDSGERINPYGGQIFIGPHVWLGLESMVLGGSRVGADCVVGARSIVKGSIPDGSVAAGSPAKSIRSGVTWSHNDFDPAITNCT